MDEMSELPPGVEIPEDDTQPLSQDYDDTIQSSQQSENRLDEAADAGHNNVQDDRVENTPPSEHSRKHRSHQDRSSRHRSHRRHHSRRSKRHREEEEDGYAMEEDPLPPTARGEMSQGDSGEMEDGEILEDGEIATDDEEGANDRDIKGQFPSRTSLVEAEGEEGAAVGVSNGGNEAVNEESEPKQPRLTKNQRKRRRERDKRRREKEEKKKKNPQAQPRRPVYIDHDRMEEDGGNRWPAFSGDGNDEDEFGGNYHGRNSSNAMKRQDSRDPYYYGGGRDSPPGLYDSPSEDSDDEMGSNQPSMTSLVSDEFIDANVAANEKEQLKAKIARSRDKKRNRLGKRKAELSRHSEQPKKRPLLEIPMADRPICKFFKEGKCAKGVNCPFNHDVKPKRLECCKFYLAHDGCTKGENCIYMHDDYPCKYYHTGAQCFAGDNCRFSHDQLTDETRRIVDEMLHGKNRDMEMDENRPKKPSLLGDPPRHVKEAAERAKEIKKIPSLFDIEVFPPGQKPPASMPTGFYSELGGKSPPSDNGLMDSPVISSCHGLSSSQSLSPGSSQSTITSVQSSPSLLGSPNIGGMRGPNNGPMMGQGPMGRMMGPRGGPMFGMQQGMNAGSQQGMNPRMQQGMNMGMGQNMQQGMNPNMRQGMNPNMQQGMNSGMQQGMNPGMQQGMQQGMNSNMQQGMNSDMQQGMNQNMQQGMNPRMQGMNVVMLQGMGSNMQGMQQRMPNTGMQGMNSGMRPGMMQQGMNQNMQGMNQGMNQNMQQQGMMNPNQQGMNMRGMNPGMQQGMNTGMQGGMGQQMGFSMGGQQTASSMPPVFNMIDALLRGSSGGNFSQNGPGSGLQGEMIPQDTDLRQDVDLRKDVDFRKGNGSLLQVQEQPPTKASGFQDSMSPPSHSGDVTAIGLSQNDSQESSTEAAGIVSPNTDNGLGGPSGSRLDVSGQSDTGLSDDDEGESSQAMDQLHASKASPGYPSHSEDDDTDSTITQRSLAGKDDEAVLMKLPPMQRQLFMRIRQQQQQQAKQKAEEEEAMDADGSADVKNDGCVAKDDKPAAKGADDDDWYSSDDDDSGKPKAKLADILKTITNMPSVSASSQSKMDSGADTISTPVSSTVSTFNVMQMIQSIKSQAQTTPLEKSPIQSFPTPQGMAVSSVSASSDPISAAGVSQKRDPRQRASDPRKTRVPTSEPRPVQPAPNVLLPPLPTLFVDPPVTKAVPSTPMTYRVIPVSVPASKPYWSIPAGIDPAEAPHNVDPRLKRHLRLVEERGPEPKVIVPAKPTDPRALRRPSTNNEGGNSPSSRPNDPRLKRAGLKDPRMQADPRTQGMGPQDPRMQNSMPGQDPRLQNLSGPNQWMGNNIGGGGMMGPGGMPGPGGMVQQGNMGVSRMMQNESWNGPMNLQGGPMGMQQNRRGPMGMQQSPMGMQQGPMGMQQGMQQGPMGMQQGPMGMQQGPMGMQQNSMGPMGMQPGPMGMQQGQMGMQQGQLGMQQGPMGMQQGQLGMQGQMGMQQGPMGMQQGPMGMQQDPRQGPMGFQGGPMGMQQGPLNGPMAGQQGLMGMPGDPRQVPMGGQQGPMGGQQDPRQGPMGGQQDPRQGPMGGQQDPRQGPMGGQQDPRQGPMGGQQDPRQGLMGGQQDSRQGPMGGQQDPRQGPMGGQQDPRQGPPLLQRGSSDSRMGRGQGGDTWQVRSQVGAIDHRVARIGQESLSSSSSSPCLNDPYLSPTRTDDSLLPHEERGSQGSLHRTNSNDGDSESDSGTNSLPQALREPPSKSDADFGIMDDMPNTEESAGKRKKFDYRNDPRFKRKPASSESAAAPAEEIVRKFRGQRKSSMEYASPLGGGDDQSSSESGYNSYNRPPPGRENRLGPRGDKNSTFELPRMELPPHTSQRSQSQTPPPVEQTIPPELFPPPPEPQLKDLFKTIDPTASPFC